MRAPSDEGELVRPGASGDAVSAEALWDAHGARAFAFCARMVGDAAAAADAAQDAFLLAHSRRSRPRQARPTFAVALFSAARTTSFELLGRRDRAVEPRARGRLSAAALRLRPHQRAALALTGLAGLSHAEVAAVLGVVPEAVPALLARTRLRLYDELAGTALAAAAVRSPDCEDVLPLLAAAADGELEPADATWADPHIERCSTCPRTICAMADAAATYAAWSPAAAPSWLRSATLAELAAQEPAVVSARRSALSASPVSAEPVPAASAALVVRGAPSLRSDDPRLDGARLRVARSLAMAATATAPIAGAVGAVGAPARAGEALAAPDAATTPPAADPP